MGAGQYGEAEYWRCSVVLDPLAEIERKVDFWFRLLNVQQYPEELAL